MTDTISTYIEPPHSVFSVLEETVFKDPGDGLGPMDFIDGMLRRRIITALRGDIKELIYCLKLIANREVLKYQNQAWSSRSPRHASSLVDAPSIADVLVLLGLAAVRDDRKPLRPEDPHHIRFAAWVVAAANKHRGGTGSYDRHLEDWHDRGSLEESRITIEFDF